MSATAFPADGRILDSETVRRRGREVQIG